MRAASIVPIRRRRSATVPPHLVAGVAEGGSGIAGDARGPFHSRQLMGGRARGPAIPSKLQNARSEVSGVWVHSSSAGALLKVIILITTTEGLSPHTQRARRRVVVMTPGQGRDR